MRFSKFIVPEEGGFAKQLAIYLEKVKKQLDKHQGKVWYTGNKHEMLKAQFMGKNTLGKLPHDIVLLWFLAWETLRSIAFIPSEGRLLPMPQMQAPVPSRW